jgi:hypothetical protein
MEEAAALWRLTGDEKYARWAAEQLSFYAENYDKWPLQTVRNPARLMHQSLDEAVNLLKYVRAARWLEGHATPAQKQLWTDKLFRPEAELLGRSLQRIHNIACWQRSAQAAVALYTGDEALWQLAVEGEFGLRNQMRKGVTDDFLWLEQSLLYNNYVVSAVTPFFVEASLAGRATSLRTEMLRAQNLLLAPVYLRFPDGKLPTPADSTGGFARAPNRNAMAAAYRVFPTRLGLREASAQRTLATLIDPPEALPGEVTTPEVRNWHLEASRMMLLRRGPWQVYFHYGQIDASHAQAEALNYEVYYESTDLTHDPGTVGYGSPLHAGFYTKGWAHNVPLIDRQGQERWQPGQPLEWKPEAGVMAAAQPVYRKDVSAERRLQVSSDTLADTLSDTLKVRTTDGGVHRIGSVLHLQGQIRVPESFEATEAPLPFARSARMGSFDQTVELPARIGGRAVLLRLSADKPFRLYHMLTPDAPPNERETLYWEADSVSSAEFSAEIVLVKANRSSRD